MLSKVGTCILCAIVAVTIGSGMFFMNDLNRATLFRSSGVINAGARFGINIGMNTRDAKSVLNSRGINFNGQQDSSGRCNAYIIHADKIYYFYDLSWRRGVVCLGAINEKISVISWYFNPLSP